MLVGLKRTMYETTFHLDADQARACVPMDLEFGHNPALSRITLGSHVMSPQRLSFRSRGDVDVESRLFTPRLPDLAENKKDDRTSIEVDGDNSSTESHEGRVF